MSNNGKGNGNENNKQRGPPDHAGPPQHVREKFRQAKRTQDGTIATSDNSLSELKQRIDWDNLSPFEEWVVAVLEDNDLLE